MTLKQLEEITGITNSYISAIENGRKKNPSTEILEKTSKSFKCKCS